MPKVSSEIKSLCSKTKNFGCLHEIIGLTYKDIGCILREFYPSPRLKNTFLIPFFSLYSFDHKNPQDNLLIEQISEKTGLSIKYLLKWFLKNIIERRNF